MARLLVVLMQGEGDPASAASDHCPGAGTVSLHSPAASASTVRLVSTPRPDTANTAACCSLAASLRSSSRLVEVRLVARRFHMPARSRPATRNTTPPPGLARVQLTSQPASLALVTADSAPR